MGPIKSHHFKRLITLTVIKLSCFENPPKLLPLITTPITNGNSNTYKHSQPAKTSPILFPTVKSCVDLLKTSFSNSAFVGSWMGRILTKLKSVQSFGLADIVMLEDIFESVFADT